MEKIGLFDLIDKFNSVASSKNEFNKKQSATPKEEETAITNEKFINPQIAPPQHYLMNEKMQVFCERHDSFAKKIKR